MIDFSESINDYLSVSGIIRSNIVFIIGSSAKIHQVWHILLADFAGAEKNAGAWKCPRLTALSTLTASCPVARRCRKEWLTSLRHLAKVIYGRSNSLLARVNRPARGGANSQGAEKRISPPWVPEIRAVRSATDCLLFRRPRFATDSLSPSAYN